MSIEILGLNMEEPLSDSVITGLYLYYGGNDGHVDKEEKLEYLKNMQLFSHYK